MSKNDFSEEVQTKQYVYIAQSLQYASFGKIDLTDNYNSRIKALNKQENIYRYVFICEVRDMALVDYDTRAKFWDYKVDNDEVDVFFLNEYLFEMYVEFIRSHPLFVNEVFIMKNPFIEQKVKEATPSSEGETSQQMSLF